MHFTFNIMHKIQNSLLPFFRSFGWRYGLQIIAAIVSTTVIIASLFRSATLYHPQRRAILHLKSQRRKVLDIGPGGSGTATVRQLRSYRYLDLHFAFSATFIASFGVNIPLVYLVSYATLRRMHLRDKCVFICENIVS